MGEAVAIRDVVCPFCALGCDDLALAADGPALRLVGPECAVAARGFARPVPAAAPTVAGAPATVEAAIARAAELLAAARLPLFAGLGTDTAGMRAVLALAERCGGIVDHAGARGLLANLRAVQDGGNVTTTLAEVRNRADLILLVATDGVTTAPRLLERCVAPTTTLFGPLGRQLVHLGPPPGPPGTACLPCGPDGLGAALLARRALATGGRVPAARAGGAAVTELATLAERLRAARYPVIVWAARELPGAHPDLVTDTLAGLIRALNGKGRCVGLPLAGPDNVVGANQVCGWQTGVPLRTSFATGAPDHDPVRWQTGAALAAADLLVWIASLGDLPLPATDRPIIALVRPDLPLPREVAVALPIGTPGLDHAGSVYRLDGVVALPLRALRDRGLPPVAEMLSRIHARLEAR